MSTPTPKRFKSIEEERRFWQTHDITELADVTPVTVRFITPRRKRTVRLSSLELHLLQRLVNELLGSESPTMHARH